MPQAASSAQAAIAAARNGDRFASPFFAKNRNANRRNQHGRVRFQCIRRRRTGAHRDGLLEDCGADFDVEPKPGGVLELEFDNGTKMIINRHTAAREIWVAAKSGGFHFRPLDGRWVNTRDGRELWAMLAALVGEQSGESVRLLRPEGLTAC
jgi:CyaY protein